MRKRFAQLYNDRICKHLLVDRLKGKTVDWQIEPYNGVPYITELWKERILGWAESTN